MSHPATPKAKILLLGLAGLIACLALALAAPGRAAAATCPNSNPIVNENECQTGSAGWQVDDFSPDLGGFTTKSSVNLGEPVTLKIARNAPTFPTARVTIQVYRMGYYGGLGGRLVHTATNVAINNDYTCKPMDAVTGKVDCSNWADTYTIPGSAFPASGVYVAKLVASTGEQTEVPFTVRNDDDATPSKMLYVLPTNTYAAYNAFGGKNLYYGIAGDNTVAGTGRAVKVSMNRPYSQAGWEQNWFYGPDYNLLFWLEREGYDVSYTDDAHVATAPQSLQDHDSVLVSGHSEYWTLEQMNAFKAARDAGVNIASFSANTAYWKVRLEDDGRTVVCYKTVEGGGSTGSGAISANDWGPDGIQGTADDALGADGIAGTPDDHPENSTTTFRDNGAPAGDPNAPPGGRVGPNMPENSLFGLMYVGDNDAVHFPLTVPAGNANGEFASDRIWRNTGISQNSSTDIPNIVNWEWDAVPTQAQYLAQQPAGVKRLSGTNVQTQSDNSWLQDEGRARLTTPPPGQPGTVNAVKYTAPSGALVFASGTMQWSNGLSGDADSRIQQATYNLFSDMGIQPETPDGVTLDPGGSNHAPVASFTLSQNPTKTNTQITFNGSGSTDSDGTISRYEWDLDGDGDFESSSTNPTITKSYSAEGTYTVRLRVTDSGGATDLAVKTLTVINNQPPSAAATANPNPVIVGQNLTLSGSGSSDPDGSIVKYEWDLDGNGTYETNAGASPTTTTSFSTSGTKNVGLRVTDNGGKTATATVPVTVSAGGVSNYGDAVLDTPGLVSYWRMGEAPNAGVTAFADSKGSSPATLFGGPTLGVPGGVAGDPNTAARFDGTDDNAQARVDLSNTSKVTVEFWLKTTFANDDRLVGELTPSYHDYDGGFLIDPDAPQNGGTFAVGIGRNASRNTAYFQRPTSGDWHHYAIVMDSSAPAASQITPYVDGQAVPYTKLDNGTGAGNFANAVLYLMSRAGTGLFGQGDLDEFAVYNRALSAQTISEHYASYGTNRRPVAAFNYSPTTPQPGQNVAFNASGSNDPDGSIVKYEWDLDGNGSYETNTGSTPTVSRSFAAEGSYVVTLRVTDNMTGIDTETKTVTVLQNQAPTASFTATPNPAVLGQTTQFSAAASNDPDGHVVKYEWDLDGDGTYETDTGSTPTASRQYATGGTRAVGLRVTDDGGKTGTTTLPVTVNIGGVSNYGDAVLDTPGLLSYWRMGEAAGPTFADSQGTNTATTFGGVGFGVPGAVKNDPNTGARFDGSDDYGRADLNLSQTNTLTVEFWLKWNAYAGDDRLAMEFTPNFNDNAGGFIVDPNAPQNGGSFGVGLGTQGNRNNVFFARPSAGSWHHYAFVMDTSAAAGGQITPYVDGQPVPFSKVDTGIGAGNFANSTLYLMSRAGQALFGGGDLDEVAVYNRALDANTIEEHYESSGTNRRPVARFTMNHNPALPGQNVTYDASTSSDPDGSIVKYEWDLDGNGTYETDSGTNPQVSRSYANEGDVDVHLRVYDNSNGTDTETHTLTVGNQPPTASFTATPNPVVVNKQVSFDASASSDPEGSIAKYEWDLDGDGTYETDTGTTPTATRTYASTGSVTVGLRVSDANGKSTTTTRAVQIVQAQQPPTATFTATPNPVTATQTVTFNASGSSDPDGAIAKYEWDLDGDGTYETDTGTTPTATRAYAASGSVDVKLRVTDGDGMTGTHTETVYVNGTGSTYAQKVLASGGLLDYWRMDDTTGTALADAKGQSPATTFGGPTLGVPGALPGASSAVSFDGVNDAASTPLDLSSTTRVTLEFWLNWDAYANDDRLAMEFTPNFNDGTGGFLVDPNSPQGGGKFGLGLGNGLSRNDAYFNRPSAGTWHYYAIVLDAGATATNQITPYVDGQPVAYTKSATGVGAGTFANSQLYLMSRAASSLFGAGDLDELAIYRRALTPAEIADHFDAGYNNPPKAAFTISPTKANPGQTVTFNASGSTDTDGSIAKYEWDLDGNGSYETSTGTTATVTKAYATPGTYQVGLRVTDNEGSTATTTSPLTVQQPPTASFTLSPNPSQQGQTVTFNGAASSDPDGTVVKYEWDLDGNGTFETNTGTTATTTKSYPTGGTYQIGLRVTDNNGATGQTTKALSVHRPPVASFTVSPSPATTRQAVTFNGSGSTDADGPIAKYEWDLDGNGTYETNTGTTATTTKTYTAPGTLTIRLRVTDGDGITNETTRSLTINSLYRQTVLGTSGLRGFWRLGEASGTTAADESPNNRPGTYQNTPTLGVAGLLAGDTDKAVDFNRSQSERVTIADNTVFDPTTVSLEAWVRNDSALSGTTNRAIIAKSNSSQSDHAYSLEYRRSGNTNQLVFTVTTSSQTEYTVNGTLNTGTTYHIVATYDGSTMRIYVNGAQVGSGRAKTGSIRNSGQSLQLGAIGSADHWDGVLDETAVYGSALSAATVLAHYNAGKP